MYIIIWAHNSREPHIDQDSKGFIEHYSTEEAAEAAAKEIEKRENEFQQSPWYHNYKIYKEV